jgi:hypothetical protein
MRIGALHDLAVQLQDQAQHAMGRRVLRAEVDRKLAMSISSTILWPWPSLTDFAPPSRRPAGRFVMPSQGERKSKLRNSWVSFTGS